MSLFQRHIQSRNKITEVSYAILQKPTTTAIISEEIMETNEEINLCVKNLAIYLPSNLTFISFVAMLQGVLTTQ